MPNHSFHAAATAALLITLAAAPAWALYKVVGPDGRVTYTDRPPVGTTDRVMSINGAGNVVESVNLPLEVRQALQRYPVTLYTMEGCEPCDGGRTLLRQRGIPYVERQIATPDDSEALMRISGARDAPTLTIGSQALRGFSAELWNGYLDSAGYPRDSRLPANYQYPAATPLTERRDTTATPAARRPGQPASAVAEQSQGETAAPAPGAIRF